MIAFAVIGNFLPKCPRIASARNSSRALQKMEGREGTASAVPLRPDQKRALAPEDCQLNVTPQGLKPLFELHSYGTTEVVPSRRKWPNLRHGRPARVKRERTQPGSWLRRP